MFYFHRCAIYSTLVLLCVNFCFAYVGNTLYFIYRMNVASIMNIYK